MRSAGPRSEKESLRVARAIARRVYNERIASGTRLASEEEALAEYQVSRATLREALRYLQLHGAIEVRTGPSGGQFVADPDWHHLASTIALLLQFANASVETVMEARLCIDPGMAAVAARNASPADIEQMGELLSEMHSRLGDYEAVLRRIPSHVGRIGHELRQPAAELAVSGPSPDHLDCRHPSQ